MHESKSSYDVLQWKEVISISVVLTLGKTCLKKKEKKKKKDYTSTFVKPENSVIYQWFAFSLVYK